MRLECVPRSCPVSFCISGVRRVAANCLVRLGSCHSEVRFEDGKWMNLAQDHVQ